MNLEVKVRDAELRVAGLAEDADRGAGGDRTAPGGTAGQRRPWLSAGMRRGPAVNWDEQEQMIRQKPRKQAENPT